MKVEYGPWRMTPILQRPDIGSRWHYGNFTIGLVVDSHPRFFNVILCLLLFEVGIAFKREALA